MNRLFADMVERSIPKFNPHVMNGLACLYVPEAQRWLHDIIVSASKSFPPRLVYEGCERCTPLEEFTESTRIRSSKRVYDIAESDLFLVRLKFSFVETDGRKEPLPDRYIYLPFVNQAGIFHLGGSLWHISGVLSDKVISPGFNSIFVRLIRDRLKFRHVGHSVVIDERRDTLNVVWSGIYRKLPKERSVPLTTKAFSSVAHYLFARHGFTTTFQKYAGFTPVVKEYGPEYRAPKNVIVCRSSYFGTKSRPSTFVGYDYRASNLCIEIPRDRWNSTTAALVVGFFYVIDHFPDRFTASRIDSVFLWSVLLGHIIFPGAYGEDKLHENIRDHFASLDDYLDGIVQEKLKEIGWYVNDFYDLIARIMTDFPSLLLGNQIDINSMYSKSIEILYYMLADISFNIFRVNYRLRKNEAKKPLTRQNVIEAFNKILTPRSIFNIQKDQLITETVSYCGDHMYPKLTSRITDQESGSRHRRKAKRVVLSRNNHLHSSMVEGGNVLFLSKSNPMPNTRLNPYVNIDIKTGTILPDPRFKETLDNLQKMLTDTRGYAIEEDSVVVAEVVDEKVEGEEEVVVEPILEEEVEIDDTVE